MQKACSPNPATLNQLRLTISKDPKGAVKVGNPKKDSG